MMSWSAIFLGWEGWLSMELALPCAFFLGFAVSYSQVNHQVGEGSFYNQCFTLYSIVELSLKGRVNGFDSLQAGLLK